MKPRVLHSLFGLLPALTLLFVPALSEAQEKTTEAAEERAEIYRKDVEFLLLEFKKNAGTLMRVKDIDWFDVSAQFREKVKNVKSDEDHLRLCQRLLARLRDGHARLEGCQVVWPEDAVKHAPAPLSLTAGKDGVFFVSGVSPSAAVAGLQAGVIVEKIDGLAASGWLNKKVDEWADRYGFSTRHHAMHHAAAYGLSGPSGSRISIEIKDAAGVAKTVEAERKDGEPPAAPEFKKQLPDLKNEGRNRYGKTADGGFGYIHLRNVPGDLPEQLDLMMEALGDVPGFILDMRGNRGGGCDHNAVFGRFIKRGEFWGRYEGQGKRPFAGPMVVILDAACASAGETVGGQFGEDQRAYMIGATPTAGMSSQKTRVKAPSGMFTAYFSVHSNKARFNRGRGIEGVGVQPHEIVPNDPADAAAGIDTQLKRACEILTKGIPAGVIDYVPPVPQETQAEERQPEE